MAVKAVEIKNASFSYGEKYVFKNLSISINEGEIFFLMGRNACGKSTLLDSILGINLISEGSISVMGKDISKLSSKDLAGYISYVPQSHRSSFPYTVREIVLMGRNVHTGFLGNYKKKDLEIVDFMLEKTGMKSLADRPYTKLSGGEMQMLMLARALAQETDIIVMDEPTAHLDCYNELLFLENIKELVKSLGKTIIMAGHSPNQALYMEKARVPVNVALMKDAAIYIKGSPHNVLTPLNIREVYNINAEILKNGDDNIILAKSTWRPSYEKE